MATDRGDVHTDAAQAARLLDEGREDASPAWIAAAEQYLALCMRRVQDDRWPVLDVAAGGGGEDGPA